MRSSISEAGRFQFSEEKPNSVRYCTPALTAALIVRRTASAPRLCPAVRGRPRRRAQRPLPSMMMATCRGGCGPPAVSPAGSVTWFDSGFAEPECCTSDLQDLFFLGGQALVDLLHVLVGQLLGEVVQVAVLVLGDLAVLLHLL